MVESSHASIEVEPNPDIDSDVAQLYAYFKGRGCDKNGIIELVCHRSYNHRLRIRESYKVCYKEDFIERLKSELSDPLEICIVSLFYSTHELSAYYVRKAVYGYGTNNHLLRFALCAVESCNIHHISKAYYELFKKSMDSDVDYDTTGGYNKLLSLISSNARACGNEVDEVTAFAEATMMKNALTNAEDMSKLATVFGSRSHPQLNATFKIFEAENGMTVIEHLMPNLKDNLGKCLMYIFDYISDKHRLHMFCIRIAITEINPWLLAAVICSRCDHDLKIALKYYKIKYKTTVTTDILLGFNRSQPDFTKALILLLGLQDY